VSRWSPNNLTKMPYYYQLMAAIQCRKVRGTEQVESLEDKRFNDILDTQIHKNENGNWEAPLPFKTDNVNLPNNKEQSSMFTKTADVGREQFGNEAADFLQNDFFVDDGFTSLSTKREAIDLIQTTQ
ncbi:Hypothetical predicted protein, partial [Paramuricea clavata]